MNVQCPHCSHDNTIEFAEHIQCGECKKTLAGVQYKKKGSVFGKFILVSVVGGGTFVAATDFSEKERYPLAVEYEIVNSCINGSGKRIRKDEYLHKKSICICALGRLEEQVSFDEIQRDERIFPSRLRETIDSCS